MSLMVKDIRKIMEQYAPQRLKEDYDNVGLMIGDPEKEVKNILVALDCTLKVIEEAKEKDCNLILTHHPILFRKPSNITTETLIGKKIIELIKNDINVFSSHTNLDSVKGGLNDLLMHILGFQDYKIIEPHEGREPLDSSSGIGRIGELKEPATLKEVVDKVKKALNITGIKYAGEDSLQVKKIAVINGSGEDYFYKAKRMGADCIITGDTSYHYVSDYVEEGIAIIDAGHFETEWPAVKLFSEILTEKLNSLGYNNKVIISSNTNPVYKY